MRLSRNPNRIIFIPYPAQGHVTPMLHLASAFLCRGFAPVVLTPERIHRRISSNHQHTLSREITFVALRDGLDQRDASSCDFFSIENAMENVMPSQLERLLLHAGGEEQAAVACVVVDPLASWAIPVANRCGVPVAGFWPVMHAAYRLIFEGIPELVRTGIISGTGCPRQPEKPFLLPDQPILSAGDLPWLIGTPAARKGRFKFWKRTLNRSKTLNWILVNSFGTEYSIGKQTSYQHSQNRNKINGPRIFHVGPLGNYTSVLTKNPSFWEEDRTCLDWLKEQKPNSVIYISFGSWVAPVGESKVRSLALALESSNRPFIWVLNPKWRGGLPYEFIERSTTIKNQGKIVSWAPQIEILKNRAVGCYLTHCGWNSTVEAIQCMKRLLCYPMAGDQFLNCKYIVKVWRIGVRIEGFGEKKIKEGMRKVMEDEEMDERLKKLHEKVMGDGASLSLTRNLTAFVDEFTERRRV